MLATTVEHAIETLDISKDVEIPTPIEIAFKAVLEQLGPGARMEDGNPLSLKIEPWPGGRWYRDLGNNAGHFWGHVQVIKPPTLLEICGPLFMSYPAASHLQYRLTAEDGGTVLKLTHRAFGQITPEHRDGVVKGWEHKLQRTREIAERRSGATRAAR